MERLTPECHGVNAGPVLFEQWGEVGDDVECTCCDVQSVRDDSSELDLCPAGRGAGRLSSGPCLVGFVVALGGWRIWGDGIRVNVFVGLKVLPRFRVVVVPSVCEGSD